MVVPCPRAVLAALATLCGVCHAGMISVQTLQECGPIESIELSMVKPQIANCQATAPFAASASHHDDVCGVATTCGQLLAYLAHMKKYPCKEHSEFYAFADELLRLCDDAPYRAIDPKSILVGKPPRPEL